jgi:hypothetical protein
MLDFRNRPVRATSVDLPLWVDRPEDREAIAQALKLGFNVLVLGDPGAGKTSLLNWVEEDLRSAGRAVVRTSGRRAAGAADVIEDIAEKIEHPRAPVGTRPRGDRVDDAYQHLLDATRGSPERTVVLADDIPGPLGHSIFGRLRDELWELDLQWVVAGNSDDEGVLLAPPAESFFEAVRYLRPLNHERIVELLARRDRDGRLPQSVRSAIAANCHGNPSAALRLAREALESSDPMAAVSRGTIVDRIAHELGSPAARLADELSRSGPLSPSDPEMLRRLGWSRPRAYQVFSALEQAGFVRASNERSGRPGRPRKTYRLVDVG